MNAFTQTGKKILDALSFSNVNNLGEFHALLRQIDGPAEKTCEPGSRDATPPASGNAPITPAIGHVQGAL
jgi:hypothetical protein